MDSITRRAFNRLLALTGMGAVIPATSAVVASAATMTARDHEMQAWRHLRAFMEHMEKADPTIKGWFILEPDDDDPLIGLQVQARKQRTVRWLNEGVQDNG